MVISTETVLLVILLIILLGALPSWPYSQSWGYYPSSIALVLAAILAVWILVNPRGAGDVAQDTARAAQDIGSDVKRDLRNAADRIRTTVE